MTLAVDRVTKLFGGLRVLDGVTLALEPNGLFGLIGPNGAGKSTLFAVISGFEAPDAGEVRFGDRRLNGLAPHARARLCLGRTFQVPRPFAHLTVRENLYVAAPGQSGERLFDAFFRPRRVRAEETRIRKRAEGILAFLQLGTVANAAAGRLSGGQRKLLELGRALMTDPKFILLDEPFAGVNPVLIEHISDRIRALHGRGTGFLVVEHNLPALARLAGHVFAMDRGRIVAEGTAERVLADPAVRDAYLGGGGPAA